MEDQTKQPMRKRVFGKTRALILAAAAYLLGWGLPAVGVNNIAIPWIVAAGSLMVTFALLTDDLVDDFLKWLKCPQWGRITVIAMICLAVAVGAYFWSYDSISRLEREEAEKQTAVSVNPYTELIRSATATVEVFAESKENINAYDINRGGVLAFAKGKDALLVFSAPSGYRYQVGGDTLRYRAVFNMDATDEATKQPILFLKQAEYMQIQFTEMPKDAQVLRGTAIITINNSVRLEISIPSQQIKEGRIFVRDIQNYLVDFKE